MQGEGSDSLLGASRATLRVPSFIDDVISAMRQMGKLFFVSGNVTAQGTALQICRWKAYSARMETFVD